MASHGSPIFSDDHASVIYRLTLLTKNFPTIPHYNTLWNAGIESRDYFGTGILNLYYLFSPLLAFYEPIKIYSLIIGIVTFLLLPLSCYCAARILKFDKVAAGISAILALCSNIFWYRWCLKYGAMGFVTSTTLVPLALALGYKLIEHSEEFRARWVLFTAITVSLTLQWPLMGIVFIPLFGFALLRFRLIAQVKYFWITAITVIALNLPWMILFVKVSHVFQFAGLNSSYSTTEESLSNLNNSSQQIWDSSILKKPRESFSIKKALDTLRSELLASNPLYLIFIVPGLLLSRPRRLAILFLATLSFLVTLGTVGTQLKPNLELERMIIVAIILSSLPVGSALGTVLEKLCSTTQRVKHAGAAVIVGFLLTSCFVAMLIAGNRSIERFTFANEEVNLLAKSIRENAGLGRAVFPGFVLHELSGGHLAPLPLLAGVPMVTTAPTHTRWWYDELIPKSFIDRNEDGIEQYFSLMNATLIVAHEQHWIGYLRIHPERYKLVNQIGRFQVFSRLTDSNYFLHGSGTISEQSDHNLVLVPNQDEVVVKFTYHESLVSDNCTILPFTAGEDLTFIRLTNCIPGSAATIRMAGPLSRLF